MLLPRPLLPPVNRLWPAQISVKKLSRSASCVPVNTHTTLRRWWHSTAILPVGMPFAPLPAVAR